MSEFVIADYDVWWSCLCIIMCACVVGLGNWVINQRQFKKRCTLSAEREAKLQQLVDEGLLKWKV